MNTGISPGGQADYTSVDEGGNGTGPGQGLNQFYAIYSITGTVVNIKQQGIGGSNNYSVVIAPAPEPSALALLALASFGFIFRRR